MKTVHVPLFIALWIGAVSSANAASPVEKYPSLDEKQLGALRHMIELANQSSWQSMEPEARLSNDSVQFQLAYVHYALAVVRGAVSEAKLEPA